MAPVDPPTDLDLWTVVNKVAGTVAREAPRNPINLKQTMNQNEITALFDEWNGALQTGDPKKVVALYADDAILLPTLSNQVRHTPEEREDYFVHFLAKGPKGEINEGNVRIFGDLAIHSGVYTFAFGDGSSAQARFTFVYRQEAGRWLIVEHHSSQMPE